MIPRAAMLFVAPFAAACSPVRELPVNVAVGYRQITATDPVRARRPIQISIWYPSANQVGSKPMSVADYAKAITVEGTNKPVTAEVAEAGSKELTEYLVSLGATRDGAASALAMTLDARDGLPLPRFPLPVVVFALGKDESPVMHADLAERVAKRGFLVVTVPTVGTHRRLTSWNTEDVFTHAADLDFAIGVTAGNGWSDTTRMAAIGYSYGSGAAVLLGERHRGMRGLVILDGSIAFKDRLPTFRAALEGRRIDVPILYLGARNDARVDQSLLRTIASHAVVTLSDSTGHLDFTTLALLAAQPGFESFMRLGDDLLPAGFIYTRIRESAVDFIAERLSR